MHAPDDEGTIKALAMKVLQDLMENYWGLMWHVVDANPDLVPHFTAFLLNPERIILYFGPTHLAIEYVGPVRKDTIAPTGRVEAKIFDYTRSDDFFADILGFRLDGTSGVRMPFVDLVEGAYVPSNDAFDILHRNGWNFAAQPMMLGLNADGYYVPEGKFARLINCFFYGTDDAGLLVRNFQWIDFLPLSIVDRDGDYEEIHLSYWPDRLHRVNWDVRYRFPLPKEFQEDKLVRLNRFIELFSSSGVDEPTITRFLADPSNHFILKMAFFGTRVGAELECDWADGGRPAIRPDFFVTQPNNYADIVEFKLPTLKGNAVVGRANREAFSAELQQYVAQTRVYREYFEDPRNREHVQDRHGIRVSYPRRWLVVGRRWHFKTDEWRSIEADFTSFSIRTYDDIVAGVRAQLYS